MDRKGAIKRIESYFDDGGFFADLARRVAVHSESQDPAQADELMRYLTGEMQPGFEALGFTCRIFPNPVARGGPFLVAERHEADDQTTVMSYGHGDVVRGYDDQWSEGLDPWVLEKRADRWYGGGTADN